MDNIVDVLLEEVEEDIKQTDHFNRFLEDINMSVILEEDEAQSNQTQQPDQNQQNNGKNAGNILDMLGEKFSNIISSADSFLEKQTNNISKALGSVNEKVNNNKYVKLANDISLNTIGILKVPTQVIKAGTDLKIVGNVINKWSGGVIGGLKQQCNGLSNTAKKGVMGAKKLKQENNTDKIPLLQKLLNQCNNVIGGLTDAIKSVGQGFSSIWKALKTSLGGGKPQ